MINEDYYYKERVFSWNPRFTEDGKIPFAWFRKVTIISYTRRGDRSEREIAIYKSEEGLMADILKGQYSELREFPE